MDGGQERVDIAEAARRLGLTPDGVRKRVRRGTLPHVRQEGRIWVMLAADETPAETLSDTAKTGRDGADAVAADELRARVASLETELARTHEALRRAQEAEGEQRRIIAGLMQRLPELAAPSPSSTAPVESPTPAPPAVGPVPAAPRPWWRRWRP